MNRYILSAFLIFWLALMLQPAVADQQNPLLTSNSIILSHNGVYRFDRDTLKPQWQSLAGIQTYHPVMGKDLLYVGSTQGLFALNPENGDIVWQIEATKTIFSPAVSGRLYAGSLHGALYAINPLTGSIDWQKQFDGWIYSPLVLTQKNQIWAAGQSHQATFLDSINGSMLGKVDLGQEAVFSPQQIDDHHIAINLFNGSSALINFNTSSFSGRLDGSSQPRHLSINGNSIYRSSRDGRLAAFDRLSRQTKWQRQLVSSNLSMHPAIPGYLLLSDLDSRLLLVDLSNNKVVYQTRIPGQLFSPVQVKPDAIVYFSEDSLQPNQLRAVKLSAGNI